MPSRTVVVMPAFSVVQGPFRIVVHHDAEASRGSLGLRAQWGDTARQSRMPATRADLDPLIRECASDDVVAHVHAAPVHRLRPSSCPNTLHRAGSRSERFSSGADRRCRPVSSSSKLSQQVRRRRCDAGLNTLDFRGSQGCALVAPALESTKSALLTGRRPMWAPRSNRR